MKSKESAESQFCLFTTSGPTGDAISMLLGACIFCRKGEECSARDCVQAARALRGTAGGSFYYKVITSLSETASGDHHQRHAPLIKLLVTCWALCGCVRVHVCEHP